MECLPPDAAYDILSRLPVESVLDFKLVCKILLNLLSHGWYQFAKMHHRRQLLQLASHGDASGLLFAFEIDEEDRTTGPRLYYDDRYNVEMNIHENWSYKTLQKSSIRHSRPLVWDVIVGSCNGLVCLNRYHHGIRDPIHLCNPNTGEYVNLPEYTLSEGIRYAAAYGFGYVHSVTDDAQYKVVRIYYQFSSSGHCKGEVEVYTIGSGSGWRTIGRTSHKLFRQNSLGIFINGALHWIDLSVKKIVAFDLGDEEFRLMQSPPCYDSNQDCCFNLQVLRGNLSFCHQKNEDHILDIWSLTKKNTTEAASWSKDFSIAYDSTWERDPLMPLLITKKNEILFVHQGSIENYCIPPHEQLYFTGSSGGEV